jgi:hypothetical protein
MQDQMAFVQECAIVVYFLTDFKEEFAPAQHRENCEIMQKQEVLQSCRIAQRIKVASIKRTRIVSPITAFVTD